MGANSCSLAANLIEALNPQPHDVVSFVGGGGKTTTILRLGGELAEAGKRVILSTTTRIGRWQAPNHKLFVVGATGSRIPVTCLKHIEDCLTRQRVAVVVGEAQADKFIGVHPHLVSDLQPLAECVLVEADGARSRPLKAPAPYEPVWPAATTVAVAVAGIDAVGARLEPQSIHRPERVAAVTGLGLGEPITARALAACVLHPDGLFARVPSSPRRAVLINKVKTGPQLALAREIADVLTGRDPSVDVIIADVQVETVKIW